MAYLRWISSSLIALAWLVPTRADAADEATISPSDGSSALVVKVEGGGAKVRYRVCRSLPCTLDVASREIVIATDAAASRRAISVDAISLGGNKSVAHVKIESRAPDSNETKTWEAILAPIDESVIFAGPTGYTKGEETERTGTLIEISPARADGSHAITTSDIREEVRLCGQDTTPLHARVLDPSTWRWRAEARTKISQTQIDPKKLIASDHGATDPALAKLLVAQADSIDSFAGAISDGDPKTTWKACAASPAECNQGGRGDFVVMRAPSDVPITKLSIVIAPPARTKRDGHEVAPKDLILVTDTKSYALGFPEDAASHPGAAYDVTFADPIQTSCLALVVEDAYAHGARPVVAIAEVTAYSAFDSPNATLDQVAAALSGGGARAEAAAGILKRAGGGALSAVTSHYDALDSAGRGLAVDVAASASCESSARLLLRAATDDATEVSRKAREKLERCGKRTGAAAATAFASADAKTRAKLASILATLAPNAALEPLRHAMGSGDSNERAAIRAGFARAARSATSEQLTAFVNDEAASEEARVDLLRALGDRLNEMHSEADASIAKLISSPHSSMATRYLLVTPLAILARGGDAHATAVLTEMIAKDLEGAVRAHATDESRGIDALTDAILARVADPDPRVREAAVSAIASHASDPRIGSALRDRLANDEWAFVRTAAANAFVEAPAREDNDAALATAITHDASPHVRARAAAALIAHNAQKFAPLFRERLDDPREDMDVRVAAARALGKFCDRSSSTHLEKLAAVASSSTADEGELQLGLAAIEALGHLRSPDVAHLVARLQDKRLTPVIRNAAAAAEHESAVCPQK